MGDFFRRDVAWGRDSWNEWDPVRHRNGPLIYPTSLITTDHSRILGIMLCRDQRSVIILFDISPNLAEKSQSLSPVQGSLIRGLVLLMFHFLYILFFINPILDLYNHPQMSIFVGSIRVGHWQVPSYTILFISSALSMLAWTDIAVSLLLFLICRGEGQNRPKRNIVIIILCASLILLISPGLQILLLPLIPQYFSQGNYVMAMLVTWMIGRYQCAFPFVGFGIMGAVVGLMLAYEFPREFFLRIMYGIGLIAEIS